MRSACALTLLGLALAAPAGVPPLPPDTAPLDWQGDIASRLVDSADTFLLRELDRAAARRDAAWTLDTAALDSVTPDALLENRRRQLARMLGLRDTRVPPRVELITTPDRDSLLADGSRFTVRVVRWQVLDGLTAEGLFLQPMSSQDNVIREGGIGMQPPALQQGPLDPANLHDGVLQAASPLAGLLQDSRSFSRRRLPTLQKADVVLLPDADQTPEMLAGLSPGLPPESQFARRLVENGCRVLVPALISRHREPRNGRAVLTHREYLYRPSFELGRHLIGFELQKAFAAVDYFAGDNLDRPIGVAGHGEGGMLALYAAALDDRIDAGLVSGHFDDRTSIWQQPIDRNVFGLLNSFGDAELAAMAHGVVIEAAKSPELTIPGEGGAPATLVSPPLDRLRVEFDRAKRAAARLGRPADSLELVIAGDDGQAPFGSSKAFDRFLSRLDVQAPLDHGQGMESALFLPDAEARLRRQIAEIDRFNQRVLEESPDVRVEFMKGLDTSSLDAYRESSKPYRDIFRERIIGSFDRPLAEPNPRARQAYDTPKWTGHEVVLDVFDGFFAYGVLLVPKDIEEGERRPVVVCLHGLEGRPQELITGDDPAYHDFAAKLAERGFVVFAPQHLYLFGDRFRTLQRKANPLGKTLFSLMIPQHEQLLRWLKTLPYVDGDRIGFYGLSYGGKSAMRIPAAVEGYALSICSADFNDWVWKNASTRSPYSYVRTNEYEIFEFDLGDTFNYAEMAALIAPRPFMVERGHFDGVAPDERVASEYAKVRRLYAAKLKRPDLTEIEFFDGPHTINGQGTFRFLHRHLNWPEPATAP